MTSKKITILFVCIACLFALLMSGFTVSSATDEFVVEDTVPLYLNGLKVFDGYKNGDTTYVSVRSFSETICDSADINWDLDTQTVSVTAEGLELTAKVGDYYICANGRYLLVDGAVDFYDGTVILPIRVIGKVLGADIQWDEQSSSVSIIADDPSMIESAESFYDETDLYWLSRLINSESGNQPMEGKIAVGNVVMNRVANETCPDTIYGVIFDAKYGVQFSVVSTGGIYAEPNEESVIAAKICLEGDSVVGTDCIYFVNPTTGASSWFKNTRSFIATYGDHDFYA